MTEIRGVGEDEGKGDANEAKTGGGVDTVASWISNSPRIIPDYPRGTRAFFWDIRWYRGAVPEED